MNGMTGTEMISTGREVPASEVDIEVRYKETDQMGVVHHSNYLVWFELARTHHCRIAGMAYRNMEDGGLLADGHRRPGSSTGVRPSTATRSASAAGSSD